MSREEEKIRLYYPLPIAKLYEVMRLEIEPRHRVRKLIDLFEGTIQHLALIGLASYVHHGASTPYVEELRPGLERPSFGHWVNLFTSLIGALQPYDPTFLVSNPKHTYREDPILEVSRTLAQILEKPAQFQTIKLPQFLELVVGFRNKKFGHGSLTSFEAKQASEQLKAALIQWLGELSILQQWHLLSIAKVEWQDPHYVYFGMNLNSGNSLDPFRLERDKRITPNRVYLYNPPEDIFFSLFPFFIFDNDTHLLHTYSELSDQRELILKCPYEVHGAKTVYYLNFDPTVILGEGTGETTIITTKKIESPVPSKKPSQIDDTSSVEAITVAKNENKTPASSPKATPVDGTSLVKTTTATASNKEILVPPKTSTPSDERKYQPIAEPAIDNSVSDDADIKNRKVIGVSPFDNLERALRQAPVMGQFHPLVTLCLSDEVEVISEPQRLVEELDSLTPHQERSILIPHLETKLAYRFMTMDYPTCPPAETINQNLPYRISEARQRLLTSHNVANRIVADVRKQKYQTVILLLVDGLSYADVADWPDQPEPCFIDGPSITFSRTPEGKIDPQVGFPSIIGSPSLARRLVDVGLPHSRGFSYWEREQNDVSEQLFQGVPLKKVRGLADSFKELEELKLQGLYIQMVREGLDGLAHSRREVSQQEIKATVKAIHQDFRYLVELLAEKKTHGVVYLVADHGLLWKNQHKWKLVESSDAKRPRYATSNPNAPEFTTEFSTEKQNFYLWHHPHLGRQIKANDSGVHGGLSYWESIVPFVRVEVNQ